MWQGILIFVWMNCSVWSTCCCIDFALKAQSPNCSSKHDDNASVRLPLILPLMACLVGCPLSFSDEAILLVPFPRLFVRARLPKFPKRGESLRPWSLASAMGLDERDINVASHPFC